MASKAIKSFPLPFCTSLNADLVRLTRLWKSINDCLESKGEIRYLGAASCIRMNTNQGVKHFILKATNRRGRKRECWVAELHFELRVELDHMRKVDVKSNRNTLLPVFLNILENDRNVVYDKGLIEIRSCKKQ